MRPGRSLPHRSISLSDIEPQHLEPMEFIVSGSATGQNNTLEQYASGATTTTTTTTRRTASTSNNAAYSNTTNANPNENYAPYFILSLRDQSVQEGESILFEIVVNGESNDRHSSLVTEQCLSLSLLAIVALPLAEVLWDKDGEVISLDSAFRMDYYADGRATLYIPETFLDDQGYYTCTARNILGTCRSTARLNIKCE